MSLVHNWSSLYSRIKQIWVITCECELCYYAYWMDWLPCATLQMCIHESGRERIALGDAVGSLIAQGDLQLAYN